MSLVYSKWLSFVLVLWKDFADDDSCKYLLFFISQCKSDLLSKLSYESFPIIPQSLFVSKGDWKTEIIDLFFPVRFFTESHVIMFYHITPIAFYSGPRVIDAPLLRQITALLGFSKRSIAARILKSWQCSPEIRKDASVRVANGFVRSRMGNRKRSCFLLPPLPPPRPNTHTLLFSM